MLQIWNSSDVNISYPVKQRYTDLVPFGTWYSWSDIGERFSLEPVIVNTSPIEQFTLTNDTSDFLYYSTTVEVSSTGTYNLSLQTFFVSNCELFPFIQ